ncbi:MAG: hypothetical protein LBE53_02025 [Paucimonas sp.]|jgi:hypothetical protein|nr:hypothetical protein [Paucimonas sp.]
MMKLETLESVLAGIDKQPWDFALYMPHGVPWNKDTLCAVLDPDDFENEPNPDRPKFALDNNLHYALGIEIIQSIIENAKEQRPRANAFELADAFIYYYDNDAYIDLSKNNKGL